MLPVDVGERETISPTSTAAPAGRWRRETLNETIALPRHFVGAPLFRSWSGDSQKLYFWLRARVGRDDPLAPDDYRQLLAAGYLVAYATADEMMEQAVACSRNTLTKLIRELGERGVAQVRPVRRGYVFLLGERIQATARWRGQPLRCEAFYLDQLAPAPPSLDSSLPGGRALGRKTSQGGKLSDQLDVRGTSS